MCMLCVIPPNTIPTRERLENSALNNPHGFGFAIAVPSEERIIVERTMNADESINRFLELRAKYMEGYATWHARLATHGSMTVENCHPFAVGNELTYLAHNGILSTLDDKTDRSDTRIFAEDIIPAIGGVHALDNEQIFNMIDDFTVGSKVFILTVDPAAEHSAYFFHENKGWYDTTGVWWSNNSCNLDQWWGNYSSRVKNNDQFKDPYYDKYYGYDYNKIEQWNSKSDSFETVQDALAYYRPSKECWACKALIDPEVDYDCSYCGACFDCFNYAENCLCWAGSDKKVPTVIGYPPAHSNLKVVDLFKEGRGQLALTDY